MTLTVILAFESPVKNVIYCCTKLIHGFSRAFPLSHIGTKMAAVAKEMMSFASYC